MDVQGTLARLQADVDSGALASLCDELDVDLLVRFGSSVEHPESAGDVDLTYSFRHGATPRRPRRRQRPR